MNRTRKLWIELAGQMQGNFLYLLSFSLIVLKWENLWECKLCVSTFYVCDNFGSLTVKEKKKKPENYNSFRLYCLIAVLIETNPLHSLCYEEQKQSPQG